MREYELMTIHRPDLAEDDVQTRISELETYLSNSDAEVIKRDIWGKRRFAYEIDHKWEGIYVVLEITTEARDLHDIERALRLADEVVRHKLVRLPDREAARRGLLGDGQAQPAAAG